MEIGSQIKKHRSMLGLSQEALAQKIYVTRQTVSNWENEKSYPDLRSLLLLSDLFGISLDQLIKGDVETMRQEIDKAEVAKFNQMSQKFALLFFISIIAFIPLVLFWKGLGLAIWAALYLGTLGVGIRVERIKKSQDLHTYQEIVAFSEGRSLDEMERQREIGKRPYQAVLKLLAGAGLGLAVAALAHLGMEMLQ